MKKIISPLVISFLTIGHIAFAQTPAAPPPAPVPTTADQGIGQEVSSSNKEAEEKIHALRQEMEDKIKAIRQEYQAKIDELRKAARAKIQDLKDKKKKAQEEMRAKKEEMHKQQKEQRGKGRPSFPSKLTPVQIPTSKPAPAPPSAPR